MHVYREAEQGGEESSVESLVEDLRNLNLVMGIAPKTVILDHYFCVKRIDSRCLKHLQEGVKAQNVDLLLSMAQFISTFKKLQTKSKDSKLSLQFEKDFYPTLADILLDESYEIALSKLTFPDLISILESLSN